MILNYTTKNFISDKILKKLLKNKILLNSKKAFYIGNYNNGREQGYAIDNRDLKIVFAECRNTDQIAIYHGKLPEFTSMINSTNDVISENIPAEGVYKYNNIYFDKKDIKLAVKFIIEKLN
jgi:GDP-D-mannose dehydratase